MILRVQNIHTHTLKNIYIASWRQNNQALATGFFSSLLLLETMNNKLQSELLNRWYWVTAHIDGNIKSTLTKKITLQKGNDVLNQRQLC